MARIAKWTLRLEAIYAVEISDLMTVATSSASAALPSSADGAADRRAAAYLRHGQRLAREGVLRSCRRSPNFRR